MDLASPGGCPRGGSGSSASFGRMTISAEIVVILVEGVGSLLLFLLCCALFSLRRRSHFLHWTLAWFAFGLWITLGGLARSFSSSWGESGSLWLQHPAVMCGWCHLALWLTGLRRFQRSSAVPSTPPFDSAKENAAEPLFTAREAGFL